MKYKSNFGQFMTNEDITDSVVQSIKDIVPNEPMVLEPSYGTGNFIRSIKKHLPNAKIDGYEIDKDMFDTTQHALAMSAKFEPLDIKNVSCYNDDFLFSECHKKYDLIIGNPPYVELVYSFYPPNLKYAFKKIYAKKGQGRVNLVHAFMDRSFELLKRSGVIAFLLPSTILSSPWYNEVRKIIYENYSIKTFIPDVRFKGVAMTVSLLVIKKNKNGSDFIVKKGDVYQIGTMSFDGKTIKELGFKVGIGKYCWNHYKPQLNKEGIGPKLLYSSYIRENGIVVTENKNEEKKPYINVAEPTIIKNAIVFPRSNGKKLKMQFIENNTFVFENHIVYITGVKEGLKELFSYLNDNKDRIITLFNSSLLTKSEVESVNINKNNNLRTLKW